MAKGVVSVKLEVDTKDFTRAINQASKKASNDMKENFDKVNRAIGATLTKFIGYEALKKTFEISRQLVEDFSRTAIENSRKLGGEVDRVAKSYNDMAGAIGDAASRSDAFRGMADILSETLDKIGAWAKSAEGGAAINTFFKDVAISIATTIEAAVALKKILRDLSNSDTLAAVQSYGQTGVLGMIWDRLTEDPNKISSKPIGNTEGELAFLQLAARLQSVGNGAAANPNRPSPRSDGRGGGRNGGAPMLALPSVALSAPGPAGYSQESMSRDFENVIKDFERMQAVQLAVSEHSAKAGEEYFRHFYALAERERAVLEERKETWSQLGAQMAASVGDHFASMVTNVASGTASLGQAIAGMIGGIMTSIGQMLIQLGTAAVVVGALSAVPFFWGITGPPGVSAAAGVAMIAIGAGMVAGGTAIGGLGASGAQASANPGGGPYSATSANTTSPTGFWMSGSDSGRQNRTVVVNFNGSVFGGDRKRAARELGDILAGAGA